MVVKPVWRLGFSQSIERASFIRAASTSHTFWNQDGGDKWKQRVQTIRGDGKMLPWGFLGHGHDEFTIAVAVPRELFLSE
jgi:hypothetical protein